MASALAPKGAKSQHKKSLTHVNGSFILKLTSPRRHLRLDRHMIPTRLSPMPPDWYIIITDVAGSTKAIEAGRYKDVNILGACSIISILNIAGDLDIPFIFGGDGGNSGNSSFAAAES